MERSDLIGQEGAKIINESILQNLTIIGLCVYFTVIYLTISQFYWLIWHWNVCCQCYYSTEGYIDLEKF